MRSSELLRWPWCGVWSVAVSVLVCLCLSSSMSLPVSAASVRWVGAVSSSWDAAANWNTSAVPAAADWVYFDSLSSSAVVTLSRSQYVVAALFLTDLSSTSAYALSLASANATAVTPTLQIAHVASAGALTLQLSRSVRHSHCQRAHSVLSAATALTHPSIHPPHIPTCPVTHAVAAASAWP